MFVHSLLLILAASSGRGIVDASDSGEKDSTKRIAIIGGGISGSFTAKYLSDYDDECLLDITIFEPPKDSKNQGSRVSSLTLDDGTVVERGASIIFEGNKLVSDMIDGDDELEKIDPQASSSDVNDGLGVYSGDAINPFPLLLTNMTSSEQTKTMLWRYNLDLWRINQATKDALKSFYLLYDLLDSNHERTFFDSPNDVWKAIGLSYHASVSFDEYLDSIGVSSSIAWWKKLIGYQGLARSELYTGINICNNNQVNSQMTGLAALVNSAAATGGLFAIKGGNDKLILSAYRQAKLKHDKVCENRFLYGESKIRKVPIMVKTVVSDFEQNMELFDNTGESLGTFDIVILAAPLQFSGISFLGKGSMFDSSVLHEISLNEMVDSDNEQVDANSHGHGHALGHHLPSSATRPYTQVITTFLSNVSIGKYFGLDEDHLPRQILFTEKGREVTRISAIGQITGDIYKAFSSEKLSQETISEVFGPDAKVEHVKVWGGKTGGATPSFNGGGESSYSTQFLLYDGGHGSSSYSDVSAIYYTNAMESAVAAMEISAIGSKFVAKLVAKRLDLIKPVQDQVNDEL